MPGKIEKAYFLMSSATLSVSILMPGGGPFVSSKSSFFNLLFVLDIFASV